MVAGKVTDERILVVDDDRELCGLLKDYLGLQGFRVECAYDGNRGLERALSGDFDALILDVMMPGLDGFEVLKELRSRSSLPVLMLTSRGDERDRIDGLERGADDYVPKTFSTRELVARLTAVLRRAKSSGQGDDTLGSQTLSVGPIALDLESHRAELDGRPVELTTTEYRLLLLLLRRRGKVVTREEIVEMLSGREYDEFDRSVDVHVASLRRKLDDNPKSPRFIRTVRGAGYLWLAPGEDDNA